MIIKMDKTPNIRRHQAIQGLDSSSLSAAIVEVTDMDPSIFFHSTFVFDGVINCALPMVGSFNKNRWDPLIKKIGGVL